jgi:hypothetical protein
MSCNCRVMPFSDTEHSAEKDVLRQNISANALSGTPRPGRSSVRLYVLSVVPSGFEERCLKIYRTQFS